MSIMQHFHVAKQWCGCHSYAAFSCGQTMVWLPQLCSIFMWPNDGVAATIKQHFHVAKQWLPLLSSIFTWPNNGVAATLCMDAGPCDCRQRIAVMDTVREPAVKADLGREILCPPLGNQTHISTAPGSSVQQSLPTELPFPTLKPSELSCRWPRCPVKWQTGVRK